MEQSDMGDNSGMDLRIADTSLMMVFLLEECNFSCDHRVREEEPMAPGYRLSSDQLKRCLSDCSMLPKVEWVHFSGGEPTLWGEGELDLVDLLVEISNAGYEPGFTTNGSQFEDYGRCFDLFRRYFNSANNTLRLYLSIDTFRRTYDARTGRSRALDNVLECKGGLPPENARLLEVKVIVVISKDAGSLLPEGMIEHYEALGVTFVFVPLQLKGKARSLAHLCPDLSGDGPEDLGAYHRYRPEGAPRATDGIPNIVLIGSDYYFPNPWRLVARLGRLPDDIVAAYSDD